MAGIERFGVSLESGLLDRFDKMLKERNYTNRSEAIRGLIREWLVKKAWQSGTKIAGTITLVYGHHHRELVKRLTDIRDDFQKNIISAQHIRPDRNNCMEIIAVNGTPSEAESLSDLLRPQKDVKHGALFMTSTGDGL